MKCVQCGSDTKVVNSRLQARSNQVWRRRQCLECQAIFTTEETVDYGSAWTVRGASGAYQPFLPDKLLLSLYRSCQHRKTALSDAAGLQETVIKKLRAEVANGLLDSQTIRRTTQVALNRFDTAASTHYQAFHSH
jgi:transcriptional repressor NrdR